MRSPQSLEPVWLLSHGNVLAAAERAVTKSQKRNGLIGKTQIVNPLVIEPCNWVHSIGMRCALDLIYLAADGTVLSLGHLKPWRVGPYTRGATTIIEAAAGSLEKWNIKVGDTVEVRRVEP